MSLSYLDVTKLPYCLLLTLLLVIVAAAIQESLWSHLHAGWCGSHAGGGPATVTV